jgi:hypothetical protein
VLSGSPWILLERPGVDVRIALRPHFEVRVLDERRVLLLAEDQAFRLTGKLYVALFPYLDRTYAGEQIVEIPRARASEDRTRLALGSLRGKGYPAPVTHGVPAPRTAFWSERGADREDADRRGGPGACVTDLVHFLNPDQKVPHATALQGEADGIAGRKRSDQLRLRGLEGTRRARHYSWDRLMREKDHALVTQNDSDNSTRRPTSRLGRSQLLLWQDRRRLTKLACFAAPAHIPEADTDHQG